MLRSDAVFTTTLVLLALFIWLRDLSWISTADDTLPILVVLPLFICLGRPWNLTRQPEEYSSSFLMLSAAIFLIGVALNSTLLLAICWILILWIWLKERLSIKTRPEFNQLMLLPLFAFPWIALDFDRIGWWFRLSGTWVTGHLFQLAGYHVDQQGTLLFINKLPISIEEACAGLNTLQSMLVAGILLDFIILGKSLLFWLNIPFLILLAWIANTTRIVTITAAAIYISPLFAMGTFHYVGGWMIILVMFLLSWLLFSWQEPTAFKGPPP